MGFDHTCDRELPPKVEILFNGRRRVTRYFPLIKEGSVDDIIFREYGAADPGPIVSCTTGYADLKLVAQQVAPSQSIKTPSTLVQVFETLTNILVEEEAAVVDYELNGLKRTTHKYVALPSTSTAAYDGQVGNLAGDGGFLAQINRKATQAKLELTAVFLQEGEVARQESTSNNGKLSVITSSHFHSTPDTPAGYIKISSDVSNYLGYATKTFKFAKGEGTLSTEVETKFDGELTITTVTALTDPYGSKPFVAGEFSAQFREEDGYKVWVVRGAQGDGVVEDNTQQRYGGALSLRTITSISTSTGVAIHAPGEIDFSTDARDGYTLYTSRGATGAGRFSESTSYLQGGAVTRVTIKYIDSDNEAKPAGTLTATDVDQAEGYTIYTESYTNVPVAGGGVGGYADEEETSRYGGKLITTTRTAYNAIPPSPGGVLLRTSTNSGDGFNITSRTHVRGSGQIGTDTGDVISGHIVRYVVSSVNELPIAPAGATPIGTETTEADGHTLYRTTYIQVTNAVLPDEVTNRYNGDLVLTTKRSINTPPSGTGVVIRSSANPSNGYTIYESTYASGSGQIGTDTGDVISGHVVRYVVSSVNELPIAPSGATPIGTETTEADGHTLYRTTYIQVTNPVLPPEATYQLNNKLVLTTYRQINLAPSSPSGVAAKISSRVDEGQGYKIYSDTYASGEGEINDAEIRYKFNNTLTVTTKRALNIAPTAPSGTNLSLISTDTDAGNGYVLYTYTWVSGNGFIDDKTDNRSDGSVLYTVTSLNEAAGGSPPSGSTLINQDVEQGEGYRIFTRQFYSKPPGYSVPINVTVKKPGVQYGGEEGIEPNRLPQVVSISATAVVTFVDTVPSLDPVTPINSGVMVYEFAEYSDGKSPAYLYDSTYFPDYYRPTFGVSQNNTPYKGRDATKFKITFYGMNDQQGQTLTLSSEAEVYFRSGSYTVYKVTKVTGVL